MGIYRFKATPCRAPGRAVGDRGGQQGAGGVGQCERHWSGADKGRL